MSDEPINTEKIDIQVPERHKLETEVEEKAKELSTIERYTNALKNKMNAERELQMTKERQRQLQDVLIMTEGILQTYELEYKFNREEMIKRTIAIEELNKEANK